MAEDRTVREAVIEKYLVRQLKEYNAAKKLKIVVKKIGGPGWRGWPDRMVLFPTASSGVSHWLEVKRPKGGKFEPLQLRSHRILRAMGFVVRVVNTRARVDEYIQEINQFGASGVTPHPCSQEYMSCLKRLKSSAKTGATAKKAAANEKRLTT